MFVRRIQPEDTARALLRRNTRRLAEETQRCSTLLEQVRRVVPAIAEKTGARHVYLFGSLVWGGAHGRTDVDLAVEGLAPERVSDFAAEVMQQFDASVDVVPLERAAESLRRRVLEEGELLYERREGKP